MPAIPLSKLFFSIKKANDPNRTIGDIADIIARRSIGSLLALFAALNLIPLPPGTSVISGIPIVLIAVQLIFLRDRIWLPNFIRKLKIDEKRMDNILGRLIGWGRKLERYIKPRYWPFSSIWGDRFIGVASFILGSMVVLPIPLGNFLPALSAAILGMALSEQDGVWLAIGLTVGAVSLTWIAILVGGAWYSIELLS